MALVIELAVLMVLLWEVGKDSAEVIEDEAGETVAGEEGVESMESWEDGLEVLPEPMVLRFVRTSESQRSGRPESTPLTSDRDTLAAGDVELSDPDAPEQPPVEGEDLPGVDVADQSFQDGEFDVADNVAGEDGGAFFPPMPELPEEVGGGATDVAASDVSEVPSGQMPELLTLPDSLALPDPPDLEGPDLAEEIVEAEGEAEVAEEVGREEARETVQLPESDPAGEIERYLEERRSSTMRGSVRMSGEASLDVEKTPHGEYMQQLTRTIGRDWQRLCRRNENAIHIRPGHILLGITVQADGRVVSATVLHEEHVGQVQKVFTREAALGADLPSIPDEVLETLDNGQFEFQMSFLFL